jgi:hypothetical protein
MSSQAKMATATSVTLKPTDIELLVAVCKQFTKIDTKHLATDLNVNGPAASMRWTRFKEKAFGKDGNTKVDSVALKQPDIDLLVALVKQFGKVDIKQLATDLGLKTPAASMRWTRFKAKAIGKDGKEPKVDGDGESEVKSPKTPKRGKKRGRADVEGDDEESPSKKAATKKGARGKKGQVVKAEEHGEVEQIVKGEEEDTGFGDNDDRLEGGLYYEMNGENEGEEIFYEGY